MPKSQNERREKELEELRKKLENNDPDAMNQALWYLVQTAHSIDSKLSHLTGMMGMIGIGFGATIGMLISIMVKLFAG